MKYNINNKEITGKEKQYLSDDRIDIVDIYGAFRKVNEFIYGTKSDTMDASESEILSNIFTVRQVIDENKPGVKDDVNVSEVSTDSCHK